MFHRYVTGKHNREGSAEKAGYSIRTAASRLTFFLDHPLSAKDIWYILPPETATNPQPWVYGCDGKWLGRVGVFFIHRNITTKENLFWSFMANETYEAIGKDCSILANLLGKCLPTGAVSDWKGSIVASIGSHFGPIPHQRCLAHLIRQAKRLLPLHSPFEATQRLRFIASLLMQIEKEGEVKVWQAYLERWEKQYGFMLKEKTIAPPTIARKWWYTHGNVRRAWRVLNHNQDPLFVFLTNPLVPKTNNSLEGINSNLKQKLGDHRGMPVTRQASFLSWYMVFTRVKTDREMRKLWGYWKIRFLRN